MKFSWVLAFLVGCVSHQNCGANGGSEYATFLDPQVSCWSLYRGDSSEDDYAMCKSLGEEWLCSGAAWCRPLGPAIKVERIK